MMDAYQMLDRNNKGSVTAGEIIESMGVHGAYPHKDDVYLYIRRFDKSGDGKISFQEFSDSLMPSD